jgi:uncharacterized protein YndB with AHSA1/START domain
VNDHTSLRLERLFPVAPEGLFAAFVDGEQFREWFGPAGFAVSSLRFDPLNEPEYRLVMQPPTGDVFHIGGRFLAVEPPRRLVYTFLYEEPDPDDLETEVTVTFDPADPGTRLLLDQGPFKTAARRQLHHDGWTQTLERLEQYVQ